METEDTSGQGLATGDHDLNLYAPLGNGPAVETMSTIDPPAPTQPTAGATIAADEEAPAVEAPAPTREEAKAMFKENAGLAHVLTDTGWMSRDEC